MYKYRGRRCPSEYSCRSPILARFIHTHRLTYSQNLPFACPLKTTRVDGGFDIVFLKQALNKEFMSVGEIKVRVEAVGSDKVLFVRFQPGDSKFSTGERQDGLALSDEETKKALDILVDIPLIMGTMKDAIKKSAVASTQKPAQ